jgi:hypothetical protein
MDWDIINEYLLQFFLQKSYVDTKRQTKSKYIRKNVLIPFRIELK